jgi:hypothetical protein
MRKRFDSDNGAPCLKCSGTDYTYTVDDAVTYVSAVCITCGGDNMFYPPSPIPVDTTAQQVSAAHRIEAGWEVQQ